jgi:diguanylate cyclase
VARDQDWKGKYMDLLQQQDDIESEHRDSDKVLCRTIVRLALATTGLDPRLDPHLNRLRDVVRKGEVTKGSLRQIGNFSESLLRASDDTKPPAGGGKGGGDSDLFRRILARTKLTGRDAGRLKRISKQLLEDPASATDKKLDELVQLLAKDYLPKGEQEEGDPGLLGRLLGRKEESEERLDRAHKGEAVKQLLSLLVKLDWPEQFKSDVSALERMLGKQAAPEVVDKVVRDLTKVVSTILEDLEFGTRATEDFLADLTTRLKELDKYVLGGHSTIKASLESGRDLDRQVSRQVGEIESSVRGADDLQREVSGYIDQIRIHMADHLKAAEERYKEALENEKNLHQKLKEVERETSVLRQKIDEAHARSTLDAVTGLPNRKAYDERLEEEFSRWERYRTPLVLLVWDLDDFKQVNDRFGHQAGDKALHVVGQLLRKRLRKTDFVARYGGEEFVMLISNSHIDQAFAAAEEIREAVAKSPFHSGQKRVVLTISCGMSEFGDGDTPKKVFKRADDALYLAKENGKNRCQTG